MTQPTVTQAERDYVASIVGIMDQLVALETVRGGWDADVRAIIDYIRNSPLPDTGK